MYVHYWTHTIIGMNNFKPKPKPENIFSLLKSWWNYMENVVKDFWKSDFMYVTYSSCIFSMTIIFRSTVFYDNIISLFLEKTKFLQNENH